MWRRVCRLGARVKLHPSSDCAQLIICTTWSANKLPSHDRPRKATPASLIQPCLQRSQIKPRQMLDSVCCRTGNRKQKLSEIYFKKTHNSPVQQRNKLHSEATVKLAVSSSRLHQLHQIQCRGSHHLRREQSKKLLLGSRKTLIYDHTHSSQNRKSNSVIT